MRTITRGVKSAVSSPDLPEIADRAHLERHHAEDRNIRTEKQAALFSDPMDLFFPAEDQSSSGNNSFQAEAGRPSSKANVERISRRISSNASRAASNFSSVISTALERRASAWSA